MRQLPHGAAGRKKQLFLYTTKRRLSVYICVSLLIQKTAVMNFFDSPQPDFLTHGKESSHIPGVGLFQRMSDNTVRRKLERDV